MIDTAELKRLKEAGTPGPWEACLAGKGANERITILIRDAFGGVDKHIAGASWGPSSGQTAGGPTGMDDAALIVAAVNALPALLARVEELEAALKELVRIDDGQRKSTVPIYAPGSKMDQAYAAARAALKGGA